MIYIPAEKSAAELQQYAKEMDFRPAVGFSPEAKVRRAGGNSRSHEPTGILVLDRHGNVVVDNVKVGS